MTLADLRRTAVRKSLRIRFRLPNGMECLVNEHGIAEVPGLHTVPDFNLEDQLGQVREFFIDPAVPPDKGKPKSQQMSLEQLAALTGVSASDAGHHDEHED